MTATIADDGTPHNHGEAAEILNPTGRGDVLLVCDHASNHIPADMDNLGLDDAELARHIAWDIGAAALTRALSQTLDAPAVLARTSRLVIDVNRDASADSLIPHMSDGTVIPGNTGLTPEQRQDRLNRFYHPFHAAVETQVKDMLAHKRVPLVIGVHSFTPIMNGVPRPWVVGLLWNRDKRLAAAMIAALRRRGFLVGDNEPYSGRTLFYTMDRHGAGHGLPQATLEIRQDEIGDAAGVAKWARIVTEVVTEIATLPELKTRRFHG